MASPYKVSISGCGIYMFLFQWSERSQLPSFLNTFSMWQCMWLCRALGVKHVQTTAYHPLPQAAEGSATCQVQRSGLAGTLSLGVVGSTCCAKRGGWCLSSWGHVWALAGASQSAAAASTCTASCSYQSGHPQHGEACQGGGEGAWGGRPVGVPQVRVRRGGHWTAGLHVPRPIPRAVKGGEEAATGDRSKADVGLWGPPEATCRGQDSDSGTTAPTWTSAQALVIVFNKWYSFVLSFRVKARGEGTEL